MVEVYGIKNPMSPSSVGLPGTDVSHVPLHDPEEHTESFGEITAARRRWLEEKSLILFRTQGNGDLTAEGAAIANNVHAVVFAHLVVDLVDIRHRRGLWG